MNARAIVFLLLSWAASPAAEAAFGDVDPAFLPRSDCYARALSVEDGGAFVTFRDASDLGVARIDSQGRRVLEWGNSGLARYPIPEGVGDGSQSLLRAPDGGLFAVDSRGVTRIDKSGQVVTSYGNQGHAEAGVFVFGAAVQPDGWVVLMSLTGGSPTFVRLDDRGERDMAFGRNGTLQIDPFGLPSGWRGVGLHNTYGWAVRDDGGIEYGFFATHPVLASVAPDSTASIVEGRIVPQGIASSMSPLVKADPMGRLVTASLGTLDRYNADGSPDYTFGIAGRSLFSGESDVHGLGLWQEADGQWTLATAGYLNIGFAILGKDDVRIDRYSASGERDIAFGTKRLGYGTTLARLADGSLLAPTGEVRTECVVKRVQTDGPRMEAKVVEYYHPQLDHYFITSTPYEIASLDAQPFGWERTGQSFGGWAPGNLEGAKHVCRFYGDPVIGPNSHFYTGEDFECAGLVALDLRAPPRTPAWHLEGRPFDLAVPVDGACPTNLQPVYRVFNGKVGTVNGPNHRYTTSAAVYDSMIARGWVGEGTHFCAPPRVSE